MKPDWKDAPEWAKYLAGDSDGDWYWYSHLPYHFTDENCTHWMMHKNSRAEFAGCEPYGLPNWKETLETKPC